MPDFLFSDSVAGIVKSGFRVEVNGTSLFDETNENGYFEINNVPENLNGYSITISKQTYLRRIIKNIVVKEDIQLSSVNAPVSMWVGDLMYEGAQDDAINMRDAVILAGAFNSSIGDGRYVSDYDLNKDGAVNIFDISILARNYNKSSDSYPQ